MNRAVSFTNLIRLNSPDVIRNRLTLEFGKKIWEVCGFVRSRLGYTATIFSIVCEVRRILLYVNFDLSNSESYYSQ